MCKPADPIRDAQLDEYRKAAERFRACGLTLGTLADGIEAVLRELQTSDVAEPATIDRLLDIALDAQRRFRDENPRPVADIVAALAEFAEGRAARA